MEDMNKKECGSGCNSGMSGCSCGMSGCNCGMLKGCSPMGGKMCCGWGGMGKFFLLRIILMLVILWFVFEAGVKVGEFKAEFYGVDGGYWSRSMMGGVLYGPGIM